MSFSVPRVRADWTDATRMLLVVGMVLAVSLELYAVRLSLTAVLFTAWVAWPFVLLFRAVSAVQPEHRSTASGVMFCMGAALFVWSSFMAYRPASVRGSSTAALVFLFLPIWQFVTAGIIIGITGWMSRRSATSRANASKLQ